DLANVMPPPDAPPSPGTGLAYLECGKLFVEYAASARAEACLDLAVAQLPASGYPHFYRGLAREQRGGLEAARDDFTQAVRLDDPKSPNPYFRESLARVNAT